MGVLVEISPVVHARREYLMDRRPVAIERRDLSNYERKMRQFSVECVRLPERELPSGIAAFR